mgnify:FL=1
MDSCTIEVLSEERLPNNFLQPGLYVGQGVFDVVKNNQRLDAKISQYARNGSKLILFVAEEASSSATGLLVTTRSIPGGVVVQPAMTSEQMGLMYINQPIWLASTNASCTILFENGR